jgi:hypothetical protein
MGKVYRAHDALHPTADGFEPLRGFAPFGDLVKRKG